MTCRPNCTPMGRINETSQRGGKPFIRNHYNEMVVRLKDPANTRLTPFGRDGLGNRSKISFHFIEKT